MIIYAVPYLNVFPDATLTVQLLEKKSRLSGLDDKKGLRSYGGWVGGKWGRPTMFRFKRKKKPNQNNHLEQTKSEMQNDQCSISEKVISIVVKNILYFNFIVLASWHLEHLI